MEYRRLGRTGAKVSALGLGTWLTFGSDQTRANSLVDAAIEAGINLFDTANTDARGAAEISLGRALARHSRDELVVATKVWGPVGQGPNLSGLSRKHLRAQCDASLRRLGVDYLDLYQCQRYDPETTLDETLRALDDLVHAGKILYWGVSGWDENQLRNAGQLTEAQGLSPMASYQARYNLLEREPQASLFPVCRQLGLAVLAYSPLAQGVLTAKYLDQAELPAGTRLADERLGGNARRRYAERTSDHVVRRVQETAWQLGVTPAQVALAYAIRSGGATSAVMGASSPEQIAENASAVGLEVPGELVYELEAV